MGNGIEKESKSKSKSEAESKSNDLELALINKYVEKLVGQGLADKKDIIMGNRDDEITWNRITDNIPTLENIFNSLNISSLLLAKPKEPYLSIIKYLAMKSEGVIYPRDCETRTFLHDLPVSLGDLDAGSIIKLLKKRKCVITGEGVITYGTVSPEQAFVTFSSVCFACFVKFFSDFIFLARGTSSSEDKSVSSFKDMKEVFEKLIPFLKSYPCAGTLPYTRTGAEASPRVEINLTKGPFSKERDVYEAIEEVGKLTVECNLVDSYFGNISYKMGNILFITQTTSSLDELAGHIDPCPLDNSSCAGITASSEFSAHKKIVQDTEYTAVLHGHPKFAVILSMDCEDEKCEIRDKDECHIKCPNSRFIEEIPVATGEVGTGRHGLCNTVPSAVKGRRGVIVHGHGLFTVGKEDFNEAFENLLKIEEMCKELYFQKLISYGFMRLGEITK